MIIIYYNILYCYERGPSYDILIFSRTRLCPVSLPVPVMAKIVCRSRWVLLLSSLVILSFASERNDSVWDRTNGFDFIVKFVGFAFRGLLRPPPRIRFRWCWSLTFFGPFYRNLPGQRNRRSFIYSWIRS